MTCTVLIQINDELRLDFHKHHKYAVLYPYTHFVGSVSMTFSTSFVRLHILCKRQVTICRFYMKETPM